MLDEVESEAVRALVHRRAIVSSDLVRTELRRAAGRRDPAALVQAERLLSLTRLVALSPETLDAAGRLAPPVLRSLDAIHVESALLLGDDLEALVTYDDRMAEAATSVGIPVRRPR